MYIQYYAVISVKIGHCFQHKQFKLFFPTFRSQVPNETLKGLAQAKIIKKSVILFRVLNMTI